MGKIMKPGKAVLVLSGRYAGRKAIVVKNYDEGTSDKPYTDTLLSPASTGIPVKCTRGWAKNKIHKRSTVKPFVKVVNYNHLMPTRYSVDFSFEKFSAKDLKDPAKHKKLRFNTRVRF